MNTTFDVLEYRDDENNKEVNKKANHSEAIQIDT
jgi:hypothetical protein